MKNLPLEEYQQKLVIYRFKQIDAASKCFTNESISELHQKFDDIKEKNKMEIYSDDNNPQDKLDELKIQVAQAESSDFKNLNYRVINDNSKLRKKYIKKKKKIDENLKRVGKFIPSELFEKLKSI